MTEVVFECDFVNSTTLRLRTGLIVYTLRRTAVYIRVVPERESGVRWHDIRWFARSRAFGGQALVGEFVGAVVEAEDLQIKIIVCQQLLFSSCLGSNGMCLRRL